jgi:hypothetical protein
VVGWVAILHINIQDIYYLHSPFEPVLYALPGFILALRLSGTLDWVVSSVLLLLIGIGIGIGIAT